MLKSKNDVAKDLKDIIVEKCIGKKRETDYSQEVMGKLNDKYNMPIIKAADIVALKIDLNILTEFELFCVIDTICPEKIKKYFTDIEIKKYSDSRFEFNEITFPLKINMIKVRDNQYIGAISAKTLKEWGDAGLINYNQNTQRTMQHIIRGDKEYYRITLNQSAIRGICQLMENGNYISDDITLNIPDDDESSFSYNSDTMELKIEQLKAFDIIDGYHRYVSIVKECNLNPEFDYPMEIRITNYMESKAQQFIWQKDQKTKMKKIDSDSMNQEKLSNRVISRLNDDVNCIWYNQLNRNNSKIPVGILSLVIDKIFFTQHKIKKENENQEIRKVANQIKSGLENLMDYDNSYFSRQLDTIDLVCIFNCIYTNGNFSDLNMTIDDVRSSINRSNPSIDTVYKLVKGSEN